MRLLCILVSLFTGLSAAASPLRTTYQARIVKPDGLPLQASNVSFRFTIYDPLATCVLYIEDFTAINMTDSSGLISFSLGSGVRAFPSSGTVATFSNVFNNSTPSFSCQTAGIYNPQANDIRRIAMQFNDGTGWQTLPSMTINAVPYAMYALKSDNSTLFNNKVDTAFVQYSSIPTCTASQALQYTGSGFLCVAAGGGSTSATITASDITTALGYTPTNSVSFSTVTAAITSTINNLSASMSALTPSQWITSGTMISYSSGNVGIGTSTPVDKLQVMGVATTTSGTGNLSLIPDYFGAAYIQSYQGVGIFRPLKIDGLGLSFDAKGSNFIFSSGNVGVGTASPTARLDVAGEVKFGNTSSTCNATNEGQQRYNSSSKNMEFCNGTGWMAYGTSRVSCPAGFTLIGTAGTAEAFCISTTPAAASTWLAATTACYNQSPKARLCSSSEWMMACVASASGPNNMVNHGGEWSADLGKDYSAWVMGDGATCGLNYGIDASGGNTKESRCCFH